MPKHVFTAGFEGKEGKWKTYVEVTQGNLGQQKTPPINQTVTSQVTNSKQCALIMYDHCCWRSRTV